MAQLVMDAIRTKISASLLPRGPDPEPRRNYFASIGPRGGATFRNNPEPSFVAAEKPPSKKQQQQVEPERPPSKKKKQEPEPSPVSSPHSDQVESPVVVSSADSTSAEIQEQKSASNAKVIALKSSRRQEESRQGGGVAMDSSLASDYSKLPVAQLRSICAHRGIELTRGQKKAQIVEIIRLDDEKKTQND